MAKNGCRPNAYRLTQVGKLTERGKEALRRIFSAQRPMDVAQDLGLTRVHLSKVRHSDVGKAFMAVLEAKRDQSMDEVVQRLKDLEIKSVEVLEMAHNAALLKKSDGTPADFMDRHRDCPTPSQIRAAERHLERQGYAQPPVSTVLHKHLGTGKVLAEIKQRHAEIEAKERKQLEQTVETVEVSAETKGDGE